MKSTLKLYDKIVARIRDDISQGIYRVGEKIPAEPELMKSYGVGRSTIREAIKTLSISGILKVQQGSGTFVNEVNQGLNIEQRLQYAHFDEVSAVRSLLEKEIVRLAAQNHTDEDLQEIEKALMDRKEAIKVEDHKACADADIAFHKAIARASGNNVLLELYNSFTLIIRNFFSARDVQSLAHFAMNHHLHEELFKAIKTRKAKQSLQALENILSNSY